jgi:hypothetical protein
MSEDIKQDVDTSSAKFKEGVDAGLNSREDTRNWKAGNELGQELKDEGGNKESTPERSFKASASPLFMRNRAASNHGNAQDEKDEMEE